MKASKKFISLPIISLGEGQHLGYVKSLVIDAQNKAIAALVLDPKGFFKDQRIIPYSKVVSVGDDAITIAKGSSVERSTNLPEIVALLKERLAIIGTRVITQSGKTLGVAEEYFVDPANGRILEIEISAGKLEGFFSGKALLNADYIITVGQDAIVAERDSEQKLCASDKGLNDAFKNLLHSTSSIASETTQTVQSYFKKNKGKTKVNGGETLAQSQNPETPPTPLGVSVIPSEPVLKAAFEPVSEAPPPESGSPLPSEEKPKNENP